MFTNELIVILDLNPASAGLICDQAIFIMPALKKAGIQDLFLENVFESFFPLEHHLPRNNCCNNRHENG